MYIEERYWTKRGLQMLQIIHKVENSTTSKTNEKINEEKSRFSPHLNPYRCYAHQTQKMSRSQSQGCSFKDANANSQKQSRRDRWQLQLFCIDRSSVAIPLNKPMISPKIQKYQQNGWTCTKLTYIIMNRQVSHKSIYLMQKLHLHFSKCLQPQKKQQH